MKNDMEIKTFTDYRMYLQLYALKARQRSKNWSYGIWATQLNLKDTSSLTKILNGQRHPGDEIIEKLCSFFKFNQSEKSYFGDLISLQKNKENPKLCVALLEKMGKKHPHSDLASIETRSFEFFSLWYVMPLREMVRLPWFKEDSQWIARQFKFKVTAAEIDKAMKILLSLKFVERNEAGRLQIAHGKLTSTFDQENEGLQIYHNAMLENAKHAIKKQEIEQREFIGCAMAINPANIPKAKALIREFKDRFEELLEESHGPQLFQIQIQFFALTENLFPKEEI